MVAGSILCLESASRDQLSLQGFGQLQSLVVMAAHM